MMNFPWTMLQKNILVWVYSFQDYQLLSFWKIPCFPRYYSRERLWALIPFKPLNCYELMTCLQLVCETFSGWLALWHAPCWAYSLYFMWFHRHDESNKGQDCHTPSHMRQSLSALQAMSSSNGCCQLLWLVGGEHLLHYFYNIFYLFWEERRCCMLMREFVLLCIVSRLSVELFLFFLQHNKDKNRRLSDKNKLSCLHSLEQIFLRKKNFITPQ